MPAVATIVGKVNYAVAGYSPPTRLVDALHGNKLESQSNLDLKWKPGGYLIHLPAQSRANFKIRSDYSVLS